MSTWLNRRPRKIQYLDHRSLGYLIQQPAYLYALSLAYQERTKIGFFPVSIWRIRKAPLLNIHDGLQLSLIDILANDWYQTSVKGKLCKFDLVFGEFRHCSQLSVS